VEPVDKVSAASGVDANFERLRGMLRARLGIIVPDTLNARASRELAAYVSARPGGWRGVLDAMESGHSLSTLKDLADIFTITHTYFFREHVHFEFLRDVVLPELRAAGVRDLRLWSAAAASGEEAYSLLLTLLEFYQDDYWRLDAGVLATDISRRALLKGVEGRYSQHALRHVPATIVRRWFTAEPDGRWTISEKLRNEATFRWLNLADRMPAFRRPFQVIFCRNVMLYFDEETRRRVIEKLSQRLAPGGWLIIGQAEDSRAARNWLEPVGGSIYRKPRGD
jgi:chemotaxis protein methyltransferase CheR